MQVYREGVAQIAGAAPAGGIKLYLDGQEYRTPAGGKLSSGTLLTVSRQYWQGENVHVTTFAGTADLAITQTIGYPAGANYLTLRWDITSATHADGRFFYAFDSALEGNDLGDPYRDPQSGRIGVWNPGLHNRFMGLQPASPSPSAHTLGAISGPNGWAAVEASVLKSFVGVGTDNYLIALEWDSRVRSDTRWTIEVKLTFALSG
ncbi:MAG: hypothetical protein HYX94_06960 [Chloroflexi bacterium]|nr:hypothetical protein [Chloroflexota bacterium]